MHELFLVPQFFKLLASQLVIVLVTLHHIEQSPDSQLRDPELLQLVGFHDKMPIIVDSLSRLSQVLEKDLDDFVIRDAIDYFLASVEPI